MTENWPAKYKAEHDKILQEQAAREQIPINKRIMSERGGFKRSEELQALYDADEASDRENLPFEAVSASTLLEAQETTSSFAEKGTYRAQFLQGNEKEYDATIQAMRFAGNKNMGNKIHALDMCRRFAHFARDKVSGDVRVMTDSCRQRWCPMCAGQKAKYSKESTRDWIQSLEKPRFLTLTLRHQEGELLPQIQFLQDCFRRLRQRSFWKKKVSGGIWFLQVHRSSSDQCWHPHLHILLDGEYIEQGKMSDLWDLVTYGSPIIHIKAVNDPDVSAEYVARYSSRPAVLNKMPVKDRLEIIEALHGKRLSGTFGTAKCVTLTPPKIDDGTEWENLGYYDKVVSDSTTNRAALAIIDAWKMDKPVPDWAVMSYLEKPKVLDREQHAEYKPVQYVMDFFKSG